MWRDKSDFSRLTHCVGIYVSIEKLPRPQSKQNVYLVVWLIQPHNSKGRLLYFNIGIRQCRQNNLFRMCKSKIYKRLQWNQAFQNNIYSWLEHWTNRNERNKVRKQNQLSTKPWTTWRIKWLSFSCYWPPITFHLTW